MDERSPAFEAGRRIGAALGLLACGAVAGLLIALAAWVAVKAARGL